MQHSCIGWPGRSRLQGLIEADADRAGGWSDFRGNYFPVSIETDCSTYYETDCQQFSPNRPVSGCSSRFRGNWDHLFGTEGCSGCRLVLASNPYIEYFWTH